MLATVSTRLSNARMSGAVDWAVLCVGALMFTVAIVGTVVSAAATAGLETQEAEARAAL
ncbi:MAG: hypothetical protein AAFP13_04240 [Pseudomonadota bacterium]